nr:Gfo/Idh/MocA family oxidoreductase [uncultured Desulfobulbus sp.]
MGAPGRTLRVGVLGAGKHGSRYARHILSDVEGLALSGISRRSEAGQQLAKELGCPWYPRWQDLIAAPDVDCLVAALPPTLNREVAMACAEAGKPLLLEKPMAVTVKDAAIIAHAFASRRLGLTIGQTLRYNQVVNALKDRLGMIGKLASFSINQRLEPATLDWLDQAEHAGAGVSFHTAVHIFDALHYITGQSIVRVLARTRCLHTQSMEDHLVALLELEDGSLGVLDSSKIGPARSGQFEFIGEEGLLQGDQVHHQMAFIQGMQTQPLDCGEPVSTIIPLLQDWYRFLCGEGENPIAPEAGEAAIRVSAACLQSAASGQWQPVYPNS